MAEKPISVGDLVMVVRWPCCGYHLGKVFTVVSQSVGILECANCHTVFRGGHQSESDLPNGNVCWAETSWLKRLDPDALKDEQPTREELTA